jgi:hypothetical protein
MSGFRGPSPSSLNNAAEPLMKKPSIEHLLGCDGCGEMLREVIALAEAWREDSLLMVESDAFVKTCRSSQSDSFPTCIHNVSIRSVSVRQ